MWCFLFALFTAAPVSAQPPLATLEIPVPEPFPALARDVLSVAFALDPSLAGSAGLFDLPAQVPSFSPRNVSRLTRRLDRDLAALRRLPWRSWDTDDQIDVRLVYALAETLRHQLVVERMYERRPAQWLEPVANQLVAIAGYAPDRPELADGFLDAVPAMLVEMEAVVASPTRRDLDTGAALATALADMAHARKHPAEAPLRAYAETLLVAEPVADHAVIGPEAYAWRFEHALLLPWAPAELLARAQASLAEVDARLATLPPRAPPPPATPEQTARAAALTRETQLGLYDAVEVALREATLAGGWVTLPPEVGPVQARETPEAMIPLTGDGGSMNPPPTFGSANVGYWNVEHFDPAALPADREAKVVHAEGWRDNAMGPYAAHEGFPGHHLQLSLARLHPDPLRSIVMDSGLVEGWALYAEEVLFDHGGLGTTPDAQASVLRSYRARIARVVYDVNIETGVWDLQAAADYKHRVGPGEGRIDEELLRAVQWPTQLICYYAGKSQILALRQELAAKQGAAFDERAFHDALLAEGSIPVALIRAKLLGEPVPDF